MRPKLHWRSVTDPFPTFASVCEYLNLNAMFCWMAKLKYCWYFKVKTSKQEKSHFVYYRMFCSSKQKSVSLNFYKLMVITVLRAPIQLIIHTVRSMLPWGFKFSLDRLTLKWFFYIPWLHFMVLLSRTKY